MSYQPSGAIIKGTFFYRLSDDIIPNLEGGWNGLMALVNDIVHDRMPSLIDADKWFLECSVIDPKLDSIHFAVSCAKLIQDVYLSL